MKLFSRLIPLLLIVLLCVGCGRKKDPPVEITGKVAQLYPTGFNANAVIVGSIRFPDLYPSFIIENGKQQELAVPAESSWVYPLALNDSGQIVGYASRKSNQSRHALVWQNGRVNWLEDGNAVSSEATAINNAGVIVGFRITSDGIAHPAQWQNGAMREIAAPNSPAWRPTGINANGDVVGYGINARQQPHLYVWRQNRLSHLGTGYHIALNNSGQLAGDYQTPDRLLHACAWNGNQRVTLATLPQTNESRAFALNDRGQIVGSADLRNAQPDANGIPIPVLWQNNRALDLNTVRPPNAAYTLEEAVGINNSGQILCAARQGKWGRTALLTPTANGWQIAVY